jgi:ribonuclease R
MTKSYGRDTDPNKEAEAKKYDNPIPSREVILNYIKDQGVPVEFGQILEALQIENDEERIALKRRLTAMERDGQLYPNRQGFYGLVEKMDLVKGRVLASRDGPGELVSSSGERVYLPTRQMKCVFHGDIALVRPVGLNHKGKLEGRIEQIIERNTQTVTGRYQETFDSAYVAPVNPVFQHDILVLKNSELDIKPASLVSVNIVSQPTRHTQPMGEIVKQLGEQIAIDDAIDMAIKTNNLAEFWPEEVSAQADKLSEEVKENDLKNREDLRSLPFVTIDGEDAKDFDDAVYCQKTTSGGWRLFVAIADVSYYVRPTQPLDKEARARSTSVYFPGCVIPMLPERLSNGLCSLKPNVDRLALVCEMTISKEGKLTRSKFYSAVIKSQARLTYTEVADLLEGNDADFLKNYGDLSQYLFTLYELYLVLHEQRAIRGALDFDAPETRIILNDHRGIDAITVAERNDAHRLIEECMLMANVAAAKYVSRNRIPSPYRVHMPPNYEKIEGLRAYLKIHKLSLGGGNNPQPLDYAKVLTEARTKPDYNNIQLVILRSMNQAIYTTHNEGHFGLAYEGYSHFTSPIRRYPDLLTHRAIKYGLKEDKLGAHKYGKSELESMCEFASIAERKADSASQGVNDFLKCDFMKHRIGEVFEAVIVNIIGIGFFVQLKENFIEGLVHVATLNGDYYHFDPVRHTLMGERTKRMFKLGETVLVRLLNVNMASYKIDFELAENDPNRNLKRSAKRASYRRKKKPSTEANSVPKPEVKRKKEKTKKRKKRTKPKNSQSGTPK